MVKAKAKSTKRAASGYRRFAQDNSISAAEKAKSDGVSHYTVIGNWWKDLSDEARVIVYLSRMHDNKQLTKTSYNTDKGFVHKITTDAALTVKKVVKKPKKATDDE